MKIWLIHIGELFPGIDGDVRSYRYGILADALTKRGHFVTRWAPTFNHAHKKQRYTQDHTEQISDNYKVEFLYTKGYRKNISLSRVRFYKGLARVFERRLKKEAPPDIILSAIPTTELSSVAVDYAGQHSIPVVIDVRDLWPDIFLDVVPSAVKWSAKLALRPMFKANRRLLSEASGITAVSESYLDWALNYAGRERRGTDVVFPLSYSKRSFPEELLRGEEEALMDKGVNPKRFICCFFGLFEATYDLETVIDCAHELEKNGNNEILFVLCGDGRKAASLKERAGGLNNVVFPGWVSPVTIEAIMRISSVGLAPYVKNAPQSLPNKPYEYFSAGLPVVSSLSGELESVLSEHDCGITYGADSAGSLFRALVRLQDNPEERRRMGERASKLFEERFSADLVYPLMVDYLENIGACGQDACKG